MKRILLVSIIWLAGLQLGAQQVQQFSQYRLSGFSFNPAFAGSDDLFNAMATHRSQWSGFTDAPRTYFLGLHAPSTSRKMGFGGSLFTDVAGPTRRTGIQGSYAYRLQINDRSEVALGVSFGITQFTIDGTQITLREQNDQALTNSIQSDIKPDAAFGALWYGERFFLGVSATQILNNKLDLFQGDTEGRMAVHYFLTGGYRIGISESFDIEPFALVKYVSPLDPQVDISARVIVKSNLWLGATYRTSDAAAAFAGFEIMDYLTIGYSIDFTTTELRNYSNGTHEIFLGIRFGKEKMIDPEP